MTAPQTSALKPVSLEHDAWGQLILETDDGRRFTGVIPARAFPVSDPEHWVSICDSQGHELLSIENLSSLASGLRTVLEAELAHREFVPVIQRLVSATTQEPSDWVVETDRGRTAFQLNSEDDVRRIEPDQASIVDSHGIRYLIPCVAKLDPASRRILDHFL